MGQNEKPYKPQLLRFPLRIGSGYPVTQQLRSPRVAAIGQLNDGALATAWARPSDDTRLEVQSLTS